MNKPCFFFFLHILRVPFPLSWYWNEWFDFLLYIAGWRIDPLIYFYLQWCKDHKISVISLYCTIVTSQQKMMPSGCVESSIWPQIYLSRFHICWWSNLLRFRKCRNMSRPIFQSLNSLPAKRSLSQCFQFQLCRWQKNCFLATHFKAITMSRGRETTGDMDMDIATEPSSCPTFRGRKPF